MYGSGDTLVIGACSLLGPADVGSDMVNSCCCRRYALVGPNGSGKSTLLKALGNREVPIPEHIDIYFLDREIPATDMTALEAVMSVDLERQRLEKEAESLLGEESEEAQARLEDLYERWGSYLHCTQCARVLLRQRITTRMFTLPALRCTM